MKTPLIELPIVTSEGIFLAHYSDKGLAGLDFPSRRKGRVLSANPKAPAQIFRWHRTATRALKAMLAGREPEDLPPLDWTGTTEFQQSVWGVMLAIPTGKTKSYGEVAKAIGKPKAVRAVGSACGANPIPVLVPCHRILAANNKIGGFGGGLDWKRRLLAGEDIII
ncbi:MAG: methylated-DNA--[protein]-cysteine S-methyltransferase [Verrucomicrobiae bacterium]|nr:methylated-DNA--[protein]-cysteine S-methyltransferase [Verrucomicrobiae bacterium]